MAKSKEIGAFNLSNFPEEIDEASDLKIYGETSYENQLALLSHFLHNSKKDEVSPALRAEVINAIREFLSHKSDSKTEEIAEMSDEDIWTAAESAEQYGLFADFFNVPFPAPEHPSFTFIDLFAGIGGFRIAMQNLGGKCVYSSEFDAKAQESYLAKQL